MERLWEPEDHGVFCETLSASNVRSYTRKVSQAWCLSMSRTRTTIETPEWSGESWEGFDPTQELQTTKEYREWGIVFSRDECTDWWSHIKWSSLKAHPMSDIIVTEQVILRNVCMRVSHNEWKKEIWIWKRAKRRLWEGLEEGKARGKWCELYIISKKRVLAGCDGTCL